MTIHFKSTPENWRKEFLGLKRNTVRKMPEEIDVRFEILYDYEQEKLNLLTIEIENTKTGEVFNREVKDVTRWEEFFIISW